jgi:hypothetical protein
LLHFTPQSDGYLGEDKAALQLVKRLDCSPLAITQAGSYIASTGMTASDYLSRFKDAKPRAWADYATRMKLIFSTSVDEVFEKAYKEVEAKDLDALNLLTLCSFMAAENIPGIVLETGSDRRGIWFLPNASRFSVLTLSRASSRRYG